MESELQSRNTGTVSSGYGECYAKTVFIHYGEIVIHHAMVLHVTPMHSGL